MEFINCIRITYTERQFCVVMKIVYSNAGDTDNRIIPSLKDFLFENKGLLSGNQSYKVKQNRTKVVQIIYGPVRGRHGYVSFSVSRSLHFDLQIKIYILSIQTLHSDHRKSKVLYYLCVSLFIV